MWYMGEEFDRKKNREYKTLEGGLKQAQLKNLNLYDEKGALVHEGVKKAAATMTDDVPDGALDQTDDGSVKTYDENGNLTGTITAEEAEAAAKDLTETVDGVEAIRVSGKIRRVFKGKLRIRKRPSWGADAVCGVSLFTEKTITHVLDVDGKPMYRTIDGYYISGKPEHVEFVEE